MVGSSGVVGVVADPRVPVPARILRRRQESADVFTVELAPPGPAGSTFAFAPGQYNMLWLFGVGEVPISISGDPARTDRIVHTIRSVGPVTRAMASLGKGDALGVRGPYGTAWPVAPALSEGHDVVVVAGGLGLAPLRPAIDALVRARRRRGTVTIFQGARTPRDLLFDRDLCRWSRARRVVVARTVDRATPEWTGSVGVVTALLDDLVLDPDRTLALVCGPEVMARFTVRALLRRKIPAERLFVSLERNMKCGVGLCGHCQLGASFVCKDGPVFSFDRVAALFGLREV